MTRGYALVLTLLVLAAAWIAGWYSTTRVVYLAPALLEQPSVASGATAKSRSFPISNGTGLVVN